MTRITVQRMGMAQACGTFHAERFATIWTVPRQVEHGLPLEPAAPADHGANTERGHSPRGVWRDERHDGCHDQGDGGHHQGSAEPPLSGSYQYDDVGLCRRMAEQRQRASCGATRGERWRAIQVQSNMTRQVVSYTAIFPTQSIRILGLTEPARGRCDWDQTTTFAIV